MNLGQAIDAERARESFKLPVHAQRNQGEVQRRVLAVLAAHGKLTGRQVAALVKVEVAHAMMVLLELTRRNLVARSNERPRLYWRA